MAGIEPATIPDLHTIKNVKERRQGQKKPWPVEPTRAFKGYWKVRCIEPSRELLGRLNAWDPH